MRTEHPKRTGHGARRRGTAYILVLAITSMLIVLGISATQIARGELSKHKLENDQVEARLAALSAQEYFHKQFSGSMTWRAGQPTGNWVYYQTVGGSRIFYAFLDQIDGDVTNDYSQPVLLYTMGITNDAIRAYRVELIPDDSGNLTRNAASFEQVTF